MYTDHFGLNEKPFALLPDPRFLFLGSSHREALAHLLYGIEEGEGFIEIVGQVGTGKTTLCRTLLDRVGPEIDIAFIFNPSWSETELLAAINRELGIPTAGRTRTQLIDELNAYLLERKAARRRVLLVIDEAQNLQPDVLEQIRLLSNLETEREKLLQIIMLGQPELEERLSHHDLRQLRQRITVRWFLRPFSPAETTEYVKHRLRIAGARDTDLFSKRALRVMYAASQGVPRLINSIADRALLVGFSEGRHRIDARIVRRAARELPAPELPTWKSAFGLSAWAMASLVLAGIALGLAVAGWSSFVPDPELPPVAAVAPSAQTVAPAAEATFGPPIDAPVEEPVLESAAVEGALPEEAGLEEVLRATGANSTAAASLDSLLYLWGYPPLGADELDPNLYASAVHEISPLRVFATRTTLERLQSLNVPAILELEVAPEDRRYVTLTSLDSEGVAGVEVGDRRFDLARPGLDRLWTRRVFLIWTNYESLPAMSPGMNGSAVRWIQARLTDLGYLNRGDPSGQFDRHTADALRRFQVDRGLEATGEVGTETMIAIYQELRYGAPRLAVNGQLS